MYLNCYTSLVINMKGPGNACGNAHLISGVSGDRSISSPHNTPTKEKASGPQSQALPGQIEGAAGNPISLDNSHMMVPPARMKTKQQRRLRVLFGVVLGSFALGAAFGYYLKGVDLWRFLLLGVA